MVRFRLCQIGYALVFFFLVPLGDLLENRKLMIATALVSDASPADAGMTESPSGLLITSLLIGFSSVSVQILIPLAAHLASEESRCRVVGGIMVSSLLGVLLARPVSSLIADHFGGGQWGAIGAIATPVSGRLADAGHAKRASLRRSWTSPGWRSNSLMSRRPV